MGFLRLPQFNKQTRKKHVVMPKPKKDTEVSKSSMSNGVQLALFQPMSLVMVDKRFDSEQLTTITKAINRTTSHVRTAVFHPDFVHSQLEEATGSFKTYQSWVIQGTDVAVTPRRLLAFRDNARCICCGIEGNVYIAERHVNDVDSHQYMNLYAIDDNYNLVLVTVDHILPDSYGGKYHHSNFQTMCSSCNMKKNNTMTNEEIQQVLLDKSAHVKEWIDHDFIHELLLLHLMVNDATSSGERSHLLHELARFRKLLTFNTTREQFTAGCEEIKKIRTAKKASVRHDLDDVFDKWTLALMHTFSWLR